MPGPDHDPRPEGECANPERRCYRRKGQKCDYCKALNAWYMRDWKRRNPERAKANEDRHNAKPRRQKYKTEYNRTYQAEHRDEINASRSARYWADPDKGREQARRSYYRRKYGITPEQADALRGGICPVCQIRPRQHVDHDHATGEIRGGLCMTCNTHIGWAETVGLDSIARYLKWEQTQPE